MCDWFTHLATMLWSHAVALVLDTHWFVHADSGTFATTAAPRSQPAPPHSIVRSIESRLPVRSDMWGRNLSCGLDRTALWLWTRRENIKKYNYFLTFNLYKWQLSISSIISFSQNDRTTNVLTNTLIRN